MKQCNPNQSNSQTSSGTTPTHFDGYSQSSYAREILFKLKSMFTKKNLPEFILEDNIEESEAFLRGCYDQMFQGTNLPLNFANRTESQLATLSKYNFLNTATEEKRYLPDRKIELSESSRDPNTALSQKWIKENREAYQGRWVVLKGDQLLADASSSKELIKIIDLKNGKGKFVTVVY